MADTLYEYDDPGNQIRTGLDVNGNGVLEPASADRINESSTSYVSNDDGLWQETDQSIYADDTGTPTWVNGQMSRLTGLGAGGLVAESISIDINGNQTVSRTTINRSTKRNRGRCLQNTQN
jgi:hypothetical protein